MAKKKKWSASGVAKWLSENGWGQAIGIFKGKKERDTFNLLVYLFVCLFQKDFNIQQDRFLNIETEHVNELFKDTCFSTADKQQLALAIRKLRIKVS
jgi:hypothetical protein